MFLCLPIDKKFIHFICIKGTVCGWDQSDRQGYKLFLPFETQSPSPTPLGQWEAAETKTRSEVSGLRPMGLSGLKTQRTSYWSSRVAELADKVQMPHQGPGRMREALWEQPRRSAAERTNAMCWPKRHIHLAAPGSNSWSANH